MEFPRENGVAAGLVHIEDHTDRLGTGGADGLHQRRGFGAEAPRGNDGDLHFSCGEGGTGIDVPDQPLSGALIVGGKTVFPQKIADRPGRAVRRRSLEPAAVNGDHIMAAGAVEAGAEIRGEGIDGFVAVALRAVRAEDLRRAQVQTADALIRLVDTLQLEAFFRLIADVPQGAAAAFRERGTVRDDTFRSGAEALLAPSVDRGGRDLENAYLPELAGDRTGYKHGPAVDTRHARAIVGPALNLTVADLIFL